MNAGIVAALPALVVGEHVEGSLRHDRGAMAASACAARVTGPKDCPFASGSVEELRASDVIVIRLRGERTGRLDLANAKPLLPPASVVAWLEERRIGSPLRWYRQCNAEDMSDARLLIASLALVPLLAVPSRARAEGISPDTSSADPGPSRVRFGAVGTVAVGEAPGRNASNAIAAPGLALDLGIQVNDPIAIFVRGELATDVFTTQGAGYLVAEWTARRWLSVATGAGYDAMSSLVLGNCAAENVGSCGGNRFWSGPSIPILLAFNFGQLNSHRARRRLLRLELEGAGGYELPTRIFGWHATVGFGAAWM